MSRRYDSHELEPPHDSPRPQPQDTDRRPESDFGDRRGRSAGSEAAHAPHGQREIGGAPARSTEPRTPYRDHHWTYSLRPSEIKTLRALGTFRAIDSESLADIGYSGNRDRMEHDLKNLIRQSLISRRGIKTSNKEQIQVLTLTKPGQRFLRKQRLMPEGQSIHYGLVKPKEARHDTTLYRLYEKAARQIERDGGRVRKVTLDYDLKRQINKQLARLGPERQNPDRKNEVAQAHGVRVVNGRLVVPDLQIEYENAEGHLARVNLELATKHYRPAQLQAKAQAGFTLYASAEDSDRLRRVLNDREITAEILSL